MNESYLESKADNLPGPDSMVELSLLHELLLDAVKRTDLKGVFHVLLRGGREGAGASEGMVLKFNHHAGRLEVLAKTRGRLQAGENLFSFGREAVAELIGLKEPRLRSGPGDMFFQGCHSQLTLPVPIDASDSGLLVLESEQPNAFGPAQQNFVERLVGQTATVIRTRSRIESNQREIDCLWDVKRRMVEPSELDVAELDELLGKILQLALARTRTDTGIILMADEKTGDLVVHSRAVAGDLACGLPERLHRRREGRASGIVFWVLDNNRPYLTGNTESDPNYIPLFKGVRSHLSVPISFQDRCIGVIVVESRRANAFGPEEQAVLEELSRNVTILVRRAQLYEATRGQGKVGQGIIIRGLSPEWEEVERRVERAAATSAIVILRGESGTGKELVARSIHFNSPRKDKPLVIVNSAAIPEQLLESTLFGHVRGAFTGATYERVGEFERADGGTLFLDEIGDLSPALQVKLLRALESGEIQKIGSNEPPRRVDVRIIAATSRNLEKMMADGQFREDLYYRLHVVPIWLPPLRQYKKSIPSMAKAFLRDAARLHQRQVEGISREALELLMAYDWPGNVRELKNVIEQTVILARSANIGIEDLPERLKKTPASPAGTGARDYKTLKQQVIDNFEKNYLSEVLKQAGGNISRAAEIAGINRVNFYKLLRRHGLDREEFREH